MQRIEILAIVDITKADNIHEFVRFIDNNNGKNQYTNALISEVYPGSIISLKITGLSDQPIIFNEASPFVVDSGSDIFQEFPIMISNDLIKGTVNKDAPEGEKLKYSINFIVEGVAYHADPELLVTPPPPPPPPSND